MDLKQLLDGSGTLPRRLGLVLGAAAQPLDMDCRLRQDAVLGSAESRRWGDDVGYKGKEVRVHFAVFREGECDCW